MGGILLQKLGTTVNAWLEKQPHTVNTVRYVKIQWQSTDTHLLELLKAKLILFWNGTIKKRGGIMFFKDHVFSSIKKWYLINNICFKLMA